MLHAEDTPAFRSNLMEFIKADSYEKARAILDAHPELLSDLAQQHVLMLIDVTRANGDARSEKTLVRSLALLRRCLEVGVEQATKEARENAISLEAMEFAELASAAMSAQSNYSEKGDLSDLQEAIKSWDRIMQHRLFDGVDHGLRRVVLNDSASAYLERFKITDDLRDVDTAIRRWRTVKSEAGSDADGAADTCDNLAIAFLIRFSLTGFRDDLESGIVWAEQAVNGPADEARLGQFRVRLARALFERYKLNGDLNDLNLSIDHCELSFSRIAEGDDDHERLECRRLLVFLLNKRHELTKDSADWDRIASLIEGDSDYLDDQTGTTVVDFDCECGQDFGTEVSEVVDATKHPELLDQISDGTIHATECPSCGRNVRLSASLLIYRGADYPLIFSPAEDESEEIAHKNFRRLVVMLRRQLGQEWNAAWLQDGIRGTPRRDLPDVLAGAPREIDSGDDEDASLGALLIQLLQARSWKESREMCEQYPELTSVRAEELLGALADHFKKTGALSKFNACIDHIDLLRTYREVGADAAFAGRKDLVPATQSAELSSLLDELAEMKESGDPSRRVELCRRALQLLDEVTDAPIWAALQANLAVWLLDDPNSQVTADDVIAHYEQALRVYSRDKYPREWASVHINLCRTYAKCVTGDHHENLERAIVAGKAALEVLDADQSPELRISALLELASAYGETAHEANVLAQEELITETEGLVAKIGDQEIRGRSCLRLASTYINRGVTIAGVADPNELAIRHATEAQKLLRGDQYREAEACKLLGIAHHHRAESVRGGNLQAAIAYLQEAANGFAQLGDLHQQASCWIKIANIYLGRQTGERADNVERAISLLLDAEAALSRDFQPDDWAEAQSSLLNAFFDREKGERGENLNQAIVYGEKALSVYSEHRHPQDWARILFSLGSCDLVLGRQDNAIRRFALALRVFQRDRHRQEWAAVQNNLARAYASSTSEENLERAIEHATASLEVRSRDAHPYEWAMTHYNLGRFYRRRHIGKASDNIELAISHFQRALEINATDRFPDARRECLCELGDIYFGQQDWERAHNSYSEALDVVEALLEAAYTSGGRRKQVEQSQRPYIHDAYCLIRLDRFDEAVLRLERGRTRALNEALMLSEAYMNRLSKSQRENFLSARQILRSLEAEARRRLASTMDPRKDRQLVEQLQYARATLQNCIDEIRLTQPDALAARLDLLQLTALIPEGGAIVLPVLTLQGSAIIVLPFGVRELTPAHVVHLNGFTAIDFSRMLIASSADAPSDGWVGSYLLRGSDPDSWMTKIEDTLESIWNHLAGPLLVKLRSLGVKEGGLVVVIPTGGLGLLPLHAAWREEEGKRRYLLDEVCMTYVPSAFAYGICSERSQRADVADYRGSFTIVYPPSDLVFAKLEVKMIAPRSQALAVRLLDASDATREGVIAAATDASYLHFCCHGTYNWQDPLDSQLALSQGTELSLRDILSSLDVRRARIVMLSACETGLTEIGSVPDEQIGLSAGFLAAGAGAVISTLWDVDDLSTMLLAQRFYRLHLDERMSPAQALRQAQIWLRNLSASEVIDFFRINGEAIAGTLSDRAINEQMELLSDFTPTECPFEHPYFWAPFVYSGG